MYVGEGGYLQVFEIHESSKWVWVKGRTTCKTIIIIK